MKKIETILNYISKNGFINNFYPNSHDHQFYGPLGSMLFDNIIDEWKKFVLVKEPNMFFYENNLSEFNESINSLFQSQISQTKYLSQLPFGICCHNILPNNQKKYMFLNPPINNLMILDYFCDQQSILSSLDYLKARRLAWWKQYLGTPSDISYKHINQHTMNEANEDLNIRLSPDIIPSHGFGITYKFPWGENVIETIVRDNHGHHEKKDYTSNPSIHIKMSIEECMCVFLIDAFSIQNPRKTIDSPSKMILRLHPKLAPFKLSILAEAENDDHPSDTHNLAQVSNYVLKEMSKDSIYTYNLSLANRKNESFDSLLNRSDEMGIPYSIILRKTPLENGIIYLRNRDTALMQEIHISDIRKTISLYLNAY